MLLSVSFTVYNDIGGLPYIKSHRQRDKKKTGKACFRLFIDNTMTERNMERYKDFSKDCKESGTVAKIPQGVK